MFMSTTDMQPSLLRSKQLGWRSDFGGAAPSASPTLRAIPTDASFKQGAFYLALVGYATSSTYNLTCTLKEVASGAPNIYIGGQFGGAVGGDGNYTHYRLVPKMHHTTVTLTVSLASTSDPLGGLQPPLGIYVTKDNPSASTTSLDYCSTSVFRECLFQNATAAEPFSSDGAVRLVTPGDYLGISSTRVVLNQGALYYVTVAGSGDHEARFTLKVESD
uniref:Uncharacterized protein n=3 Tax=Hemiselmis andersenii TaxID=464988 RepID=A0A7S0Y301_HEMAN|mmetsp:Transcript_40577/g.94145  ORF Transcript_40577/g.94145 Transcript_40577/m.94145 type:complete len:218 (+) Transcript_40577:629-1282(+)